MPLAGLSALSGMWSSLLNARRKFGVAAFVPMVTPIVVVAALFSSRHESRALALAVGTMLGGAIELGILAYVSRAAGLDLFAWPGRWRPEFGQILRQFAPAAGSSILMSGTILIDQSFAASLPAGSVSSLSYGTKLAGVSASVLVVVVSTLALPVFSRTAAAGDLAGVRRAFISACVLVVLATVPLAAILSFGATPILAFVFERGNFTAGDVQVAATVQALHAWHMPFYVLSIVAVRALAAISENWLLLVGGVANLVADLLVNILFVPTMGVAAIGMATVAMYFVSAAVLCSGFLYQISSRARHQMLT
jgi:putative peptidoglycan lipid II flippase